MRKQIKQLQENSATDLENSKILLTKKELQEFIKKEIKDNLSVEIKEGESYQYGGGYKNHKTVKVNWGDLEVYESCSFE